LNRAKTKRITADEDVKHIEPLTKSELKECYAHYVSPASSHRAKLSVHLVAQAKPKEQTPEERKSEAVTALTTILAEEKIKPDAKQLQSRISGSEVAGEGKSIVDAISTHLTQDLKLEKAVADKVLDEAKAALGLAEVGRKLEHLEVVDKVDGELNAGQPVLIKDVQSFKAGLQMSAALRPVRDLSEFVEGGAKL
jgi:insulysin